MTIEGEKDDIAGIGQTQAAQDLCVNIPDSKRPHYLQLDVGHYGIFNGSRFRNEIVPRMREFWAAIDGKPAKAIPPAKVNSAKSKTGKPIPVSNTGKPIRVPCVVPMSAASLGASRSPRFPS